MIYNLCFLGSLTFYFWNIVLDLLQEDDLEVKDTAAGFLSLCDESLKGGYTISCQC